MFEKGSGDYTKERSAWLDNQSIEEIVRRIQEQPSDPSA
jgi:hypothetical protein